ncbi:MAG: hypothetical protein HY392_02520 [Candidatus Diapherotrites archaeon]|nr:hypothetical protein [Candidatus Diapherotrites archaeon]
MKLPRTRRVVEGIRKRAREWNRRRNQRNELISQSRFELVNAYGQVAHVEEEIMRHFAVSETALRGSHYMSIAPKGILYFLKSGLHHSARAKFYGKDLPEKAYWKAYNDHFDKLYQKKLHELFGLFSQLERAWAFVEQTGERAKELGVKIKAPRTKTRLTITGHSPYAGFTSKVDYCKAMLDTIQAEIKNINKPEKP